MTAPERIWLQDNGDFDAASEVTWCQHRIEDNDTEYVRADLAAVPAQVKVLAMRDAGYDTPTDPRDAVIARLVEAADGLISYLIDKTESEIGRECRERDLPVEVRRALAALASAKAVQHG